MKKLLLLLLIFTPLLSSVQALEISTGGDTEKIGIFSTLEKINKEKTALSEKEGQVDFEQQKIETNTLIIEELTTLHADIVKLEKEFSDLRASVNPASQTDDILMKAIEDKGVLLEEKVVEYLGLLKFENTDGLINYQFYLTNKLKIDTLYSLTLQKLSQDTIEAQKLLVTYMEEVKVLQDDINKSEIALQIQIKDIAYKVGFFIASFLILYFGAKFLQRIIRNKESFSEEKKQVLLSIVKWVKNIFLFSIVVFFFFSEFLTILPFLAILGTALGFALRDVISSFIAWFVIGLKDGMYTVGDVIEIEEENVFGRIVKITPLITVIQELGLSGPNGMYRSFPNKKIFERSIKNVWKQKGWIFISTDFLLEAKSDIVAAKKSLLECLIQVSSQGKFSQPLGAKTFLKKFGHTEETLAPQVFLEIRPQGVLLRGKVPVIWGERHMMRTEVVESFVSRVRKNKNIEFRYVEIGGNLIGSKN